MSATIPKRAEGNIELERVRPDHDATAQAGGEIPFHVAAAEGHIDFKPLPPNYGPDTTAPADNERTPLGVMADGGHLEIAHPILAVLEHATADADLGRTTLYMSPQLENEQVTHVPLEHEAQATALDDQRLCRCIIQ